MVQEEESLCLNLVIEKSKRPVHLKDSIDLWWVVQQRYQRDRKRTEVPEILFNLNAARVCDGDLSVEQSDVDHRFGVDQLLLREAPPVKRSKRELQDLVPFWKISFGVVCQFDF